MSVYIEYVIIDNMAVNTLLLCLVLWSLKERVPRWRTLGSAALGTLFSCLVPLFSLPNWLMLPAKLLLSDAMVLLVKGKRKFLVYLLLFYLFTFLFGGAVIGAFYLFTGQMIVSGDTLDYSLVVPVGLIVLGVAAVVLAAKKLLAVFYRRRETAGFERRVRIERAGERVELKGYLDSGNLLSLRGEPVVMLTSRAALKLLGISAFSDINCHNVQFEYIEINTMSGGKRLPVFRVDKLFVEDTAYENVWCGISFEPFKMECDAVLNCVTK